MEHGPKQEKVGELNAQLLELIGLYQGATNDEERENFKQRMRPIYDRFIPDNIWAEMEAEQGPNAVGDMNFDEQQALWVPLVDTKKACANILKTGDNWDKN